MSGTFNDLDVPPTLISFAIAPIEAGEVLSPEFKEAGHPVYAFGGSSSAEHLKAAWEAFHDLRRQGKVKAAWAVENGAAEAVMKMSFGNSIGFVERSPGGRPLVGPLSRHDRGRAHRGGGPALRQPHRLHHRGARHHHRRGQRPH